MKRIVIILVVLLVPLLCFAQFKEQTKLPSLSEAIAKSPSSLIFGFLDPSKMSMNHSFSMSFGSMGGESMMVNSYINTINYQISSPLFLRLNLGLMNSPYNSFSNPGQNNTKFVGGAELFYRPSENTLLKVGINVRPNYYYPRSYYSGFPYYGSGFDRDFYHDQTDIMIQR